METPVKISWICYGCFEPVDSYLGKAAPCENCEPTVFEDEDDQDKACYGFWVNATGIEVTSKSDFVEQDAVWEEYDFRIELLDREADEIMKEDDGR